MILLNPPFNFFSDLDRESTGEISLMYSIRGQSHPKRVRLIKQKLNARLACHAGADHLMKGIPSCDPLLNQRDEFRHRQATSLGCGRGDEDRPDSALHAFAFFAMGRPVLLSQS